VLLIYLTRKSRQSSCMPMKIRARRGFSRTRRILLHAPASAVYVFISNNSWFVRIRSERPDVTVWLLRYKKLERTLQRAAAYFYGCTRPYIFTCMFSFWASLSKPIMHVHMNASRESLIRTCHSASW
jgi:hypothetical protein